MTLVHYLLALRNARRGGGEGVNKFNTVRYLVVEIDRKR